MKEVAFVVNPVHTRHVELLKARCRQAAARHGWGALFMGTEAGETGPQLSSHLHDYVGRPGDKLVFAIGGDGTVRACADAVAGRGTALAIVPRGTANLFARTLGVPSDLAAALATGFDGRDVDVDLPQADGQTFVAMAGLGIDAAVVEGTSKLLKDHFGWLAYAVAAVPQLTGPRHEITVRIDDRALWSGRLIPSWSGTWVWSPGVSCSYEALGSTTVFSMWACCLLAAWPDGSASPGGQWEAGAAPVPSWSISRGPISR